MRKKAQIFYAFLIAFLSLTHSISAQESWKEYKTEQAKIRFLIPSEFKIFDHSALDTKCAEIIRFSADKLADFSQDSLRIEYEAFLNIEVSNKTYDITNQEHRFFYEDGQWTAKSLVGGPLANVKADSVMSDDWFGLEADIYASYYYDRGGRAVAAGNAYSFFAIKKFSNGCNVRLLFDNLGATEDSVGQQIISSFQLIEK